MSTPPTTAPEKHPAKTQHQGEEELPAVGGAALGLQQPMNRWWVVGGAILIQFCLGAIYAWSVFTKKLEAADGGYAFSAKETMGIFSAGLATFAFVMLFAGQWQVKLGPRCVAALGGIVLGAGYILGGFLGKSFWPQFICIGLIGGAGIGLGYVVPIAVGVKWFPDKKGLITGLAVGGFGFGATVWIKLAGSWFGGLLNTTHVFGLPGVQSVFVIYGVVFLVVVLLGSIVMVNPPAGWKPAGWNPAAGSAAAKAGGTVDYTTLEMIAKPQYWGLLLMFSCSAMAGLMTIGCVKLFGIDSLHAHKVFADTTQAGIAADTAAAWLAIFNGLGRIIWGAVSDKIGRKLSLFLMCLFQGVMMLLLFRVGVTELGLIVGACIIGFNFGANFALFPAATADFFGNMRIARNYPFVFLAYGIAGIAGNYVSGYFRDAAKLSGAGVAAWQTPFIIAGVACLVAAAVGLALRSPRKLAPSRA